MGHAHRFDLPHYTYDDYVQWEGRWELIDGIPYAMSPAPSLTHQAVNHKIAWVLQEQLRGCKDCQALLPVDWRISEDTILQPDNLVIGHPAEGAYLTRAPVLIFEVLSKSTALKDQNTKYEIYQHEGVKYYVLVAPEDRTAKIFHLLDGRYAKLADVGNETVDFELGPCAIHFDFSLIW